MSFLASARAVALRAAALPSAHHLRRLANTATTSSTSLVSALRNRRITPLQLARLSEVREWRITGCGNETYELPGMPMLGDAFTQVQIPKAPKSKALPLAHRLASLALSRKDGHLTFEIQGETYTLNPSRLQVRGRTLTFEDDQGQLLCFKFAKNMECSKTFDQEYGVTAAFPELFGGVRPLGIVHNCHVIRDLSPQISRLRSDALVYRAPKEYFYNTEPQKHFGTVSEYRDNMKTIAYKLCALYGHGLVLPDVTDCKGNLHSKNPYDEPWLPRKGEGNRANDLGRFNPVLLFMERFFPDYALRSETGQLGIVLLGNPTGKSHDNFFIASGNKTGLRDAGDTLNIEDYNKGYRDEGLQGPHLDLYQTLRVVTDYAEQLKMATLFDFRQQGRLGPQSHQNIRTVEEFSETLFQVEGTLISNLCGIPLEQLRSNLERMGFERYYTRGARQLIAAATGDLHETIKGLQNQTTPNLAGLFPNCNFNIIGSTFYSPTHLGVACAHGAPNSVINTLFLTLNAFILRSELS
ncbi:MAG: hypothetical protein AB7F28_04750 [Candidatus Margulisiibacteriota bacterium]